MVLFTGTDLSQQIASLTGLEREQTIAAMIYGKNTPSWLALDQFVPIVMEDKGNKIVVRVSPDVVSIGSDADALRVPLWPSTAQAVANYFGAILPSRQLSKAIYDAAPVKLAAAPRPPDPSMELSPAFTEHSLLIDKQLVSRGVKPGTLVAGHKKDVVIGPNLDGSKVAIFGWYDAAGNTIQPYSTIHDARYSDYSHGIRLIDNNARYNGRAVLLTDLFQDPEAMNLVSDAAQGSYWPVFPNAGPKIAQNGPAGARRASTLSEGATQTVSVGASLLPVAIAAGLFYGTLNLIKR
jgi:hypothetical protein